MEGITEEELNILKEGNDIFIWDLAQTTKNMKLIELLEKDYADFMVNCSIARNPNISIEMMKKYLTLDNQSYIFDVLRNKSIPEDILKEYTNHPDSRIRNLANRTENRDRGDFNKSKQYDKPINQMEVNSFINKFLNEEDEETIKKNKKIKGKKDKRQRADKRLKREQRKKNDLN